MVFYVHVVYVVICYSCMSVICLVLGPSSGSSDSVRIYRRVIFGNKTSDVRERQVPNIYRCMIT
jgi:hypothetical protein